MPANPDTGKPYTPRRWQSEALPALGHCLRAGQKPLIIAATGTGKAKLAAEVCRLSEAVLPDGQCIVVGVPTQNLVRQIAVDMRERCQSVGVYFADKKQPEARIIVCCYKSVAKLAEDLEARGASVWLLVCDEAHRTEGEANRTAIQALKPKRICGFSATPFLTDSSRSLSLFDSIAYTYTIDEAIRDGVLVPPVEVGALENWHGWGLPPGEMVDLWCAERIAGADGAGVCSANNIPDADAYAQYLREFGVAAESIHSEKTPKEQRRIIDALKGGGLKCVVHPVLMSEGVDIRCLRWMCLRRSAASKVRLVQEVGRGLRSFPGKTNCLIFDAHGIYHALGLRHAASIGGAMDAILAEDVQKRDPSGPSRDPGIMPPLMAVSATSQWARLLLLELQVAGLAKPSLAGGWRDHHMPTKRQVEHLRQLNKRYVGSLPERVKVRFKSLAKEDVLQQLPSGAVSDLIGVLEVIRAGAPKPVGDQAPW
ncbi:MAG: DEAD/DEAH box helicase family protein, partial [Dehalococcoidia bacterium]